MAQKENSFNEKLSALRRELMTASFHQYHHLIPPRAPETFAVSILKPNSKQYHIQTRNYSKIENKITGKLPAVKWIIAVVPNVRLIGLLRMFSSARQFQDYVRHNLACLLWYSSC